MTREGTGKTFTAVSDAKKMGGRTLFLAHTKELVTQAQESFHEIWPEVDTGIYLGARKDRHSHVVCGTIQGISSSKESFDPEEFDYLVIDEAHHGAASTYKEVLTYFKPKFTLGLTATPERADGEDILDIFQNLGHRLDLKTAVELGELVSVRCIRVKTNIDLSDVRINGIKYNSRDLESKLFLPDRNKVIVETYLNMVKDKKTVIFCASVAHAEEIAGLLKEEGVNASAVSGSIDDRKRKKVLVDYFIDYYEGRRKDGLIVETKRCMYVREPDEKGKRYTRSEVKRNILSNPFKRFEDMNFIRHHKNIGYLVINRHIFKNLDEKDIDIILEKSEEKLKEYFTS